MHAARCHHFAPMSGPAFTPFAVRRSPFSVPCRRRRAAITPSSARDSRATVRVFAVGTTRRLPDHRVMTSTLTDSRPPAQMLAVVLAAALTVGATPSAGQAPAPAPARSPREGATGRAAADQRTAPWIVWPPSAESCAPAAGDAAMLLARARAAIGLDALGHNMLRRATIRVIDFHDYESDRTYRPFITMVTDVESILDPTTGVERDSSTFAFNGFGGGPPNISVRASTAHAVFAKRDTAWVRADGGWRTTEASRALDPWTVVQDWSTAGGARLTARCQYRNYPRTVVERHGIFGAERLYIDAKTGFPVKLDREEPHYLWGQQHVEYVYMSWLRYGGTLMPATAAKLIDGDEEQLRETISARPIPRDSVPPIAVPDSSTRSAVITPGFLRPTPVDTMRLGPQTFALRNPGYTELVTLSRDTVVLFDATQGEERSRTDSAWIGRLFPGHHPVAVVVTDLAWPHVSGMRFWVASGATIVSRDISEPFLGSVVARRWTAVPDKLARAHARLRFLPVRDSLRIAGITILPIDGIASEGALMAYLLNDRFLWASDYVQDTSAPTLYASEVYAAACRARLTPTPTRGGAEHVPPFEWSTLTNLAHQFPLAGAPSAARSCGSAM